MCIVDQHAEAAKGVNAHPKLRVFDLARTARHASLAMPVPEASPSTASVTAAFSLTMAHFCTVTVAGARMLMEFAMRCTVPSPAQDSLAVMLAECVTTVPF